MELDFDGKISLLVFDLDGTLVDDAKDISDFTLNTVKAVMERGVKVTTASGRHPFNQQQVISKLGFKGPFVASNGALIVDSTNDSILYNKAIDPGLLERFCAFAMEEDLVFTFQTMDCLHFSWNNPWAAKFIKDAKPLPGCLLPQQCAEFTEPTYKVAVHVTQAAQIEKLSRYLAQEPDVVYTLSDKEIFEINPRETSKGAGIAWVAHHYGIPLDEVCAFGDYENDISMFAKVGLPIAMGNALASLKAQAKYITDTNNNDGVAKALIAMEKLF